MHPQTLFKCCFPVREGRCWWVGSGISLMNVEHTVIPSVPVPLEKCKYSPHLLQKELHLLCIPHYTCMAATPFNPESYHMCSALANGIGKSGYVPLSPALSSLFPTPMFIIQIHNGCCFPSKSPINASNSPLTSSALRMGRVSFQSGSTSGSDSASIALQDA